MSYCLVIGINTATTPQMAAPIPAITNRRSMPITSARGPAKIKPIGPARFNKEFKRLESALTLLLDNFVESLPLKAL